MAGRPRCQSWPSASGQKGRQSTPLLANTAMIVSQTGSICSCVRTIPSDSHPNEVDFDTDTQPGDDPQKGQWQLPQQPACENQAKGCDREWILSLRAYAATRAADDEEKRFRPATRNP